MTRRKIFHCLDLPGDFFDDARRKVNLQRLNNGQAIYLAVQEALDHLLSISFIATVVLLLDVQAQALFGRVNFAAALVRAAFIEFELRLGFAVDDLATVISAISRVLLGVFVDLLM
jgi:hypothetical protein